MRVTYFTSNFATRMILFYLMMFSAIALGFAGHVVVGALVALPFLLAAMMGVSITLPALEKRESSTKARLSLNH